MEQKAADPERLGVFYKFKSLLLMFLMRLKPGTPRDIASEDLALKNVLKNGVRKNNGPTRIRDQFCLSAKDASSDGPQGPN